MDVVHYQVLHVAGVILLAAWSFQAFAHPIQDHKSKLLWLTGLAAVAALVGGFGLLAQLQYGWPVWILIKVGAWFVLTAMAMTVFKASSLAFVYRLLGIAVIGVAVWAVYFRPFTMPA